MVSLHNSDVLIDMCTQRDYLLPGGAQRIANADQIVPNLKHVIALARWGKVPMISCVDVRRPDEVRGLPNQTCVLGTPGQQKVSFSLLRNRVVIESDNCLCVPLDVLAHHQQAILTKHHRDPFTNPKIDRLLTELPHGRYIIFGAALETSIRLLALGLLLRQRTVAIVQDACGYWNSGDGEMTLRQLAAKGCQVVQTRELLESVKVAVRRAGEPGVPAGGRRSVA